MAARQFLRVIRSLATNTEDRLSHSAAVQASSALMHISPASSSSSPLPASDAPFWAQAFSTKRSPAKRQTEVAEQKVPFELQKVGGKEHQDLDLEEPTGIFHIYDREEPNERDEDDPGVPWGTISLTGPPPDHLSPNLSLKSKSAIYAAYKEDPTEKTVAKLAAEYKILKQRVQAIICLKEREEKWEKEVLEKQDDETKEWFKEMEECLDEDTVERGGGERLWLPMATRMKPKLVVENDEYEADAVVSTSGMSWDKASERYEWLEYLEFMQRLRFNRRLTNQELKVKAEERKKPEGGWTYMIEELGKEGKRGKGGGRHFVASSDGTQRRSLTELEKLMLTRKTPKRRKFDYL